MVATLLSPAFLPFSLALGLLFGLLALEVVALLVGGSLFAADGSPDVAAGPDPGAFDVAPGVEPDLGTLVAASAEAAETAPPAAPGGGALGLLGLGRVPFAIWLAGALLGFGLAGLGVQALAAAALGGALPGWLAALPAAAGGLAVARATAGTVGAAVRMEETTATGPQFLGGLRGTVTQGIARRGAPAEVRLRDRHGNTHYLRCEPHRDADVIAEGAEVLTLRHRRPDGGWALRIVALPT